jgi:hypothetical protein
MSRSAKGFVAMGCAGGENFTDSHALRTFPEGITVDGIAVAEEVGRCGVVREGIYDLLSGPAGGGMLGDIEMDYPSAMVSEQDENEEHPQACGRDREEIEGDEISDMVGEERPPRLGWRCAPLRHQAGNGALREVEAELEEARAPALRRPGPARDFLPERF